jgi:protein-tyrosine phosphatase
LDQVLVLSQIRGSGFSDRALTIPSLQTMREAVAFILERSPFGGVYVHCTMGLSRCACIAAAYLLAEGMARTPKEAIDRIQAARPHARIPAGAVRVLQEFVGSALRTDSVASQHKTVRSADPTKCT